MPERHRSSLTTVGLTLLFATAIDVGAGWALGHTTLEPDARIVVALLPLPANLVLLAVILRAIRRLDEFQKRVHFEAVTVAFLLTGLAVFIYGYLQKAGAAGPLNMGLVWIFMCVSYAIGYGLAVNHYR